MTAILCSSAITWGSDLATFVAALAASGTSVSVTDTALALRVRPDRGQPSLLPGGGGAVEATLDLGIGASGSLAAWVFAGVLVYRLISV